MLNDNEHKEITARDVVLHLMQSVRMAAKTGIEVRRKLMQFGALDETESAAAMKTIALLEMQIGLADDYESGKCDGLNLAKALELNASQVEKLTKGKK